MTKFFLVGCDYWKTFEEGEEGLDYKFKMLVNTAFDSFEKAKEFVVEYAKNHSWDIEYVGEEHIYKTDNKNDLADITIVEGASLKDVIDEVKYWG